jgi:hypothetical protein
MIEFGSFDEETDPSPIDKENDWGQKIRSLEYGILRENNLLYYERDWVEDERQDEVDSLEVEFWFRCTASKEDQDKLQVLFLTFREEIMLGIRKSRVFIKVNNKSKLKKVFFKIKIMNLVFKWANGII